MAHLGMLKMWFLPSEYPKPFENFKHIILPLLTKNNTD